MALTTLKSLNAEIKQLEAQKKLVEKRDGEVPKALAVLQKYSKVLTPAQRRQVAKLIGEAIEATPANPAPSPKAPKSPLKGRKLGKIAPKYRLPTGETWAGRGLAPTVFAAWAKSPEGRAWAKANPSAKFPPADGTVTKSPTKAAKKVTKAVKKASKAKTARKAVKKSAKKAVKKP